MRIFPMRSQPVSGTHLYLPPFRGVASGLVRVKKEPLALSKAKGLIVKHFGVASV
jgi:hypothetical protein